MSHNITQAIERAARAYLVLHIPAWLPEAQVYRGVENPEEQSIWNKPPTIKRYPCVVLLGESAAAQLPNFGGAWNAKLAVEVWDNRFAVTGDEHDERAKVIFDLFLTSTTARDLVAAFDSARRPESTERLSLAKVIPEEQSIRTEGKGWCSVMSFNLAQAGIQEN